jgi:VanZ family protein
VIAALAMPRRSALSVACGLALFGAAIEVTQLIPGLRREASLDDWLADVVAIAAGLLITSPIRRRLQDA